MDDSSPQIGTLRERPLHASLKKWYAQPGDGVEVPVDGFVIDLVRENLLIEIQTRGFSSMKEKLVSLLDLGHRVRIIHPVAMDRWIVRIDDVGTISRRLSPKHGKPADVFAELVSIPDLVSHRNLEIEVVLTEEEEYRRHTPNRSWRRKGWSVVERHLVEVVESHSLRSADDLAALLPTGLPVPFTTADLGQLLGRPRRTAQQMTYCLRIAGVISVVGKKGNALEYRVG